MASKKKTTSKKKVIVANPERSRRTKKAAINKQPQIKSFKLCKESGNFVTFRFTKQTLYWAILLGYILLMDVWITNTMMSSVVQGL